MFFFFDFDGRTRSRRREWRWHRWESLGTEQKIQAALEQGPRDPKSSFHKEIKRLRKRKGSGSNEGVRGRDDAPHAPRGKPRRIASWSRVRRDTPVCKAAEARLPRARGPQGRGQVLAASSCVDGVERVERPRRRRTNSAPRAGAPQRHGHVERPVPGHPLLGLYPGRDDSGHSGPLNITCRVVGIQAPLLTITHVRETSPLAFHERHERRSGGIQKRRRPFAWTPAAAADAALAAAAAAVRVPREL